MSKDKRKLYISLIGRRQNLRGKESTRPLSIYFVILFLKNYHHSHLKVQKYTYKTTDHGLTFFKHFPSLSLSLHLYPVLPITYTPLFLFLAPVTPSTDHRLKARGKPGHRRAGSSGRGPIQRHPRRFIGQPERGQGAQNGHGARDGKEQGDAVLQRAIDDHGHERGKSPSAGEQTHASGPGGRGERLGGQGVQGVPARDGKGLEAAGGGDGHPLGLGAGAREEKGREGRQEHGIGQEPLPSDAFDQDERSQVARPIGQREEERGQEFVLHANVLEDGRNPGVEPVSAKAEAEPDEH